MTVPASAPAELRRFDIQLPDRQLACAPLSSAEGQAYLGAMAAATNFAGANRHVLAHRVREAIARVLGAEIEGTRQVYDVAHNVAKILRHAGRELCVHRKGATRAFPPGPDEIPVRLPGLGPARLHPGIDGHAQLRARWSPGRDGALVRDRLPWRRAPDEPHTRSARDHRRRAAPAPGECGVVVRCPSNRGLAEEAPFAYKDVERVVGVGRTGGARGARRRAAADRCGQGMRRSTDAGSKTVGVASSATSIK